MAKKRKNLTEFGKAVLVDKCGDGSEDIQVEYDSEMDSAQLTVPITPHKDHVWNFAEGTVKYSDLSYGGKGGDEGEIIVYDIGNGIDVHVEYDSPVPTGAESGATIHSCSLSLSRSLAKEVGLALLRHAEYAHKAETKIKYTRKDHSATLHLKEIPNVSEFLKQVDPEENWICAGRIFQQEERKFFEDD
jgi:hypothetical protein